MKLIKFATLGFALAAGTSFAECEAPELPTLPNGATSTMEDMLNGQKAVKAYQDRRGHTANGIVTGPTWKALRRGKR